MRAVVMDGPGLAPHEGPFAEPEPRGTQEILTLVAAGVHQVVRSRASGAHYSVRPEYPLVPGVDAVARTPDGRAVYTGWIAAPWGTMAERMAARAGFELPSGCDPLAVAAGMNPGMSGFLPLAARRDSHGALGTVVVLGATGMSGRLAVQTALALGATRVVAIGRNTAALEQVASGDVTTVALTNDATTTSAAVVDALAGADPAVVLDYLWGPPAEAVLDALVQTRHDDDEPDISYVSIGSVAGPDAAVPSALLRARRITLSGSGMGSVPVATLTRRIPEFIGLIAEGTVHVPYRAFGFAEAERAWTWDGPERAVVVPG